MNTKNKNNLLKIPIFAGKNTTNYRFMPGKSIDFFKNALKAIIPLLIGILIFLKVYDNMEIESIWAVLQKDVKYQWIILSLVFVALGHVVRGLRWQLLIIPLGKKPKAWNAIAAVFANYLINLIIPRLGEVSRCGLISKYEKISFSKTLGTLITERIIDLLSLGIIIVLAFSLKFDFLNQFLAKETGLMNGVIDIISSIWMYVGIILFSALCWIIYKRFKETNLMKKIVQGIKNMGEGIKSIWEVKNKSRFSILTLSMWIIYFLEFYVCCFAFPFTENITILQCLFIFVMANIGIVVPVQGGIGPWHFMVIHCLILLGINNIEAAAFALVVHGTQMLMTILLGIIGLLSLPLTNKENTKTISSIN